MQELHHLEEYRIQTSDAMSLKSREGYITVRDVSVSGRKGPLKKSNTMRVVIAANTVRHVKA